MSTSSTSTDPILGASSTSTDPILGAYVHAHLQQRGVETPLSKGLQPSPSSCHHIVKESVDAIMNALGLDLNDDSLRQTPARVAKMYLDEVFYGLDYDRFPTCTTVENKMGYDELIISERIDVLSFCEHHLVPFIGHAHIAYIPHNKVLGLSKFNRIVDFFSRRPQIQERLTEQIFGALSHILETENIGVVINAQHLCVMLRGVKQPNSRTTTSKMGGKFFTVPTLRQEFLSLVRGD